MTDNGTDRRSVAGGPSPAVGEDSPYQAVLFDMDGVVTDTARLHLAAWRRLIDDVLADARAAAVSPARPADLHPFSDDDYRRFIDGRSREDGLAEFLRARRIAIPAGAAADPATTWTVAGLAARKNELFGEELASQKPKVYENTVALIRRLRGGNVRVGLVTASRHADDVLAVTGMRAGKRGLRARGRHRAHRRAARRA